MRTHSVQIEINNPNDKDEVFSKMKSAMMDFLKDAYPSDKRPPKEYRIYSTITKWAVREYTPISPRYYSMSKPRYFKTRELAEKFVEKNKAVMK